MHLKIKLFKYFSLLIFAYIPFEIIGAQQDEIIKKEAEVVRHLNRAETWYLMARETFNTLEYHKYAENEYLSAKEKAEFLPQPLKDQYTNTAEAGYKQTYWRKINAWNSFRNIFPAAWWYSGSDYTLDYTDEDHLMLALEKSWQGLEGILPETKLTPKLIIIPRCNDSEDFDQSTDCGEIKDQFLNIIDLNTSLLGIRDDALATALGAGWKEFANGGKPSKENIKILGEFYQADNIVVVDIDVVDEFEEPVIAGRINIQYNQWDSNSMELMSTANDNGVVISLRDRRWITPAWIAFLLVLSFAFSYYRQKDAQEEDKIEKRGTKYITLNFIFFFAGYLMSYFAGMLSDQFIPDWEAMALSTNHFLPLPEMWLWSFVHGAVIMVGPMVLCAYFLLQFGKRIPGIEEILKTIDSKNTSMVLFTVQAGALGALFSPIIVSWYQEGIILALGLSFAALAITISVAQPFSRIINSESNAKTAQILSIGIFGLLLIVPIGFFRPDWGGYWPISIAILQAIIFSSVIKKLKKKGEPEKEKSNKFGFEEGDKEGTINYPTWVDRKHKIITKTKAQDNKYKNKELREKITQTLFDEAENKKVQTFIIGKENGAGKTRLMHEIFKKLKKKKDPPWKLVLSTAEQPEKDHLAEPYSLISKAFGDAIGIANIADKQAKQAKLLEVLSSAESALPGIGALFDSDDQDHEGASKEQIIRDMIEAVREQLNKYPLAFFLDDIQWADKDSLQLLEAMIRKLSQKENENSLVFVLGYAINQEFKDVNDIIGDIEKLAKVVDLKNFDSGDEIKNFLQASGLKIPTWFGDELFNHFGRDAKPEIIIEALHALTIKKEDGTYKLIDEVNHPVLNQTNKESIKQKLNEAVPTELEDLIRLRLNDLHEDDKMILEAAAEIGRSFSVTLLAAGLERDRLTLLRSLQRIEDNFHLIIDLEGNDDIMSLESQSLRNVLQKHAKYPPLKDDESPANKEKKRELYKEMHFKIAKQMIGDEDKYIPIQIMKHCVLSGNRLFKEAIDYGIKAIISANNKQSWPTVEFIIKKIKDDNTGIIKYATKQQLDILNFYNAKMLQGIGKHREKAGKILEDLFDSSYISKYELFYTYLKNEFDQKNFQNIINKIDGLEKEKHIYDEPLIAPLCEFYKMLSSFNLEIINAEKLVQSYQELRNNVESLEIEKVNNQYHLLSMIIQEIANKITFTDLDGDALKAFDDSLNLKEKTNDLEGMAINHGVRSLYYIIKESDYSRAIEFRAKSLLMEEKRGNEQNQAMGLAKLANLIWTYSEQDIEDKQKKEKMRNDSFHYAHAAYKMASEKPESMKDAYVLSAAYSFNYGKEIGKIKSNVNSISVKFDRVEGKEIKLDNNSIIIDGNSINITDSIKEMENKVDPWDWKLNAQKQSEPMVDVEAAS